MPSKKQTEAIPVVDIFAGPGGLGEGFSSILDAEGKRVFRVVLSIEKEAFAYRTLRLRSFFRQFPPGEIPDMYYQHLRGELSEDDLFATYGQEAEAAERESWEAELGNPATPFEVVQERIAGALGGDTDWVLIGGPPCQAYSLAGRSRNKGNASYIPEEDDRQYLYKEYLKIIAGRWPSVFIMENVKGLTTARLAGQRVIEKILSDLRDPAKAVAADGVKLSGKTFRYRVYPLTPPDQLEDPSGYTPTDYLVEMERRFLLAA